MLAIMLIAFSLIFIAFPLAYLHMIKTQKKHATDLPAENEGESCVRRSALSPTSLVETIDPKVDTMYRILEAAAAKFPDKQQYGSRMLVKTHVEQKTVKKGTATEVKTWTFPELSGYTFMTYAEIQQKCLLIGAGLVKSLAGKTLAIFAPTSREWSLVANSCWSQNITIATAYDSLGPEGLAHALNEGKLASLFTSTDLLKIVRGVIPLVETLKLVVYMGNSQAPEVLAMKTDFPSVKFMSLEEVAMLGNEFHIAPNPPNPSDNACIMYTSGSTGN